MDPSAASGERSGFRMSLGLLRDLDTTVVAEEMMRGTRIGSPHRTQLQRMAS